MTASQSSSLRFIGLTRKSKGDDEGTHEDQRKIISDRCLREDFTLVRVDSEKGISGTKKWRDREVGRAVEDCNAGKADGIIVAFEDRISRESMAETASMWEEFREVGLIFIACDGVDSRVEGSNLTFAIKAAIARDKIEVTAKRSNLGRKRAVEELGIHGGDDAPFGYCWTPRPGAKNLSGNVKHGPLDIDPETAPLLVQTFEARAAGAGMRALVGICGLSDSAVRDMLRNRVYLGIAYSGEFENRTAHPALVSEELFTRVGRTFTRKQPSKVVGRDNSMLSRTLICATCGGEYGGRQRHLVLDRSLGSYRCKNEGRCAKPVTITAERIEGYTLDRALAWHRQTYMFWHGDEEQQAEQVAELSQTLGAALTERDEIEADTSLSALRKAQALTAADAAVAAAEQALSEAEAESGWAGMAPEAVERRLAGGDLQMTNEFIREMLRIVVKPVGRGRKVPVENRVEVRGLAPGGTSVPVPVMAPTLAG